MDNLFSKQQRNKPQKIPVLLKYICREPTVLRKPKIRIRKLYKINIRLDVDPLTSLDLDV